MAFCWLLSLYDTYYAKNCKILLSMETLLCILSTEGTVYPDETLIFDMNRSIVYKSFTHANGWQTIFAFRDSVVAIIALFRWRAENASVKKLPISVQYSFGRQVTYLGALKKFHRLILVHRCHLMTDSSCSTSKFPANISWNWQLAKTVCSPSSSLFSRSSGALGNQLFDEYSLTLISARPVLRLI